MDVAGTLDLVNAILHTDVRNPPAVEYVDQLPRHDWGSYSAGVVTISRETWVGCEGLTLAHEVSHHVAIKAGLLRHIPNDVGALKAELERIARRVEDAWPEHAPNCRTPD